ncbi:sulfatase-like hydrolase/transferase [bacterium]|nr:sulfatase-like hydrolase/transferase [bacterium]
MYADQYPAERTMFGYGVRHKDIRPDDLPFIRALYAAECSFVDDRVGKFVEGVRKLGILDDTIIVFTTDHGTHLGEEGCVQKTAALLNSCVARLPLIVRHPDPAFAGKRVNALVSATDYFPSLLDLLGIRANLPLDGKSFWPLATGEAESIHDHVVTEFGAFAAVRDPQWCYFQNDHKKDCFTRAFIQQKADAIQKRVVGVPHLYDLRKDPKEERNVVLEHPDVAAAMQERLAKRCKV